MMTRLTGDWLKNPATQSVCGLLEDAGWQALLVGGCVRNDLLGTPVSDIDIATDARPETVMELAGTAGIKAVPTGIEHGTVTLVADGLPHEVTTFRRDVETDGRRAVVAYSDHVEDDAARRDFTMNALYATRNGQILDPLNGLPDLQARRVRFIGDAAARIHEDFLRSLRYFRFHAWYGDDEAGFDPDAMSAIAANLDGLGRLSKERVGAEMLKLLSSPDPAPSVAAMRSAGVLGVLLPGADDRALAPLIHLETKAEAPPSALRRLAALGGPDTGAALRLSKAQSNHLDQIREGIGNGQTAAELGYRLKSDLARDVLLLRAAVVEQAWDGSLTAQAERGAKAVFPVRAGDLMPALSGAELGARLDDLERKWIASDFTLTREQLLAYP